MKKMFASSSFRFPDHYPRERLRTALRELCPHCFDALPFPTSWREEEASSGWQIVADYSCPACGESWETWYARALLGWTAPALAELDPLP